MHDTTADFIPNGKTVPAGHGWTWIRAGIALFRAQPGAWIAIAVIFLLLAMILQVIPILGPIVFLVVLPAVIVGFLLACDSIDRGEGARVGHLFAGFGARGGPLMLLGAVELALTVAILVFVVVVSGVDTAGIAMARLSGGLIVAILLYLALFTVYLMATWFAPALMVFGGLGVGAALRQSFTASLRNWLPLTVYSAILLAIGLGALALFSTVLGVLFGGLGAIGMIGFAIVFGLAIGAVGVPILFGTLHASYRDIFHDRAR